MRYRTRSGLVILGVVLLFFGLQDGCGAAGQPDEFVLNGVSFAKNSAALDSSSDSALEELLQVLLSDPLVSIKIKCIVAPSGDGRRDAKLGRERAEALRRWWMNRGVAFYRLQIADAATPKSVSEPPAETRVPAADRIEIVRFHKSWPIADVAVRVFRFEPVVDGQEVLHDFVLQNKGDAPLNISRVRTG